MPRVVDDPDGLRIGMVAGDDSLHVVAQFGVMPLVGVEELQQRPRLDAGKVRDWLDALLRQIAKLTANVVP